MAGKEAHSTAEPDVLTEVKEWYRFMQENGLEALEWNRDDFQVRLVRRSAPPVPTGPGGAAAPIFPSSVSQQSAPAIPEGAQVIRSPIMGIFYRAPSPSSPPFVKEGDQTKKGQVLCVVEAMKVFNEVRTEFDAKIVRVLVENGKPVKPGQELFVVER